MISVAVLILLGCIGTTVYLLFSNYRNVRLFKQAQSNFARGDEQSLSLAEAQLLQLIRNDDDHEAAFIMLGEIAEKKQAYPEQVYYCYMAYRLNPLSAENKERYIKSLLFARWFDRLENFLYQQSDLTGDQENILLYSAGRNGNISKYKKLIEKQQDQYNITGLALLLTDDQPIEKKLEVLEKFPLTNAFMKQEVTVAKAELYLSKGDISKSLKFLEEAYELNPFAFAPALGRFYANFRNFGKALDILEKHLETFHDPLVAIQTAEIYCLLKQTDNIAKLRTVFQSDSGSIAMHCCYYFDALTALAENNIPALKDLIVPLRESINTPLATFMFLCADIAEGNPAAIRTTYTALLAHRQYLDLQTQADNMISDYLKNSFAKRDKADEQLLPLAQQLHKRKPEAFTAKLILLAQKKRNSINLHLLNDALSKFNRDPGIAKIAIEYYLENDLAESGRLIENFKKEFPDFQTDVLRYEIIHAAKKNDFDRVSELFKSNFTLEILPEYWSFASSTARENDLLFLSRDKTYEPFCQALLLLKKGQHAAACDLLEKADAKGNLPLLFFAAKTLAENKRHQAAIDKYALFPANSPYQLAVLLNTAELHAEAGNLTHALNLSRQAYNSAPDLPDVQFCYADKLLKNGKLTAIPDVITPHQKSTARRPEMEKLWITGMEARIKETDAEKSPEKLRQMCTSVLLLDSYNETAIAGFRKVWEIDQQKLSPEQRKENRRDL